MGMTALRQEGEQEPRQLVGEAQTFDKLRELTRNGYVPDATADPSGKGILLRHESAPDLILRPDGTIELPIGQSEKKAAPVAPAPRRMAKLRTLAIIIFAVIFWFFSAFVTALIIEGM